ncbi:PepSY-associated TM helix domain-containing protein [Nannocystis punicea]|uniref:PepSY-associated TM helix domain-containing protein n=1 Tax=Nannocystis punicea TaxID=2995304 RepID=A0ABY7H6S3_9BACT|nr:PepSY-associated TM helix domain-containing protein [Nannocystis poenicansa]WAS94978.1 PepSY-associated TM helix domain-containing protein [Nannocystis poenicansa]
MQPSTSRWFRLNLQIHRWASLVATLPFLVLCLTGAVLVFREEIDAALGVVPVRAAEGEARVGDCLATLGREFPDQRVLSVGLDPLNHPGVMLGVVAAPEETGFERARLAYFELASGRMLGDDEDPDRSFTGVLLELHAEWFLGLPGRLLGALVGLLVLASLLSGLVLYAPYVRRIAYGVIRRGRGARLAQLDLHNFIGAVVLGWAVVVSLSGFLLGFSTIALGVWQMTDLAAIRQEYSDATPVDARHPPVSVPRVIEVATAHARSGWGVRSILYPGMDLTTPRHYAVLLGGTEGLEARMIDAVMIDADTGEVARDVELPGYLHAMFLAEPLHFGDYGGLPLKLLWTACNLLTLFITANGAWLFFDRRRAQRLRPGRAAEGAGDEGA